MTEVVSAGKGPQKWDIPIWLGCLAEHILVAQDAFLAHTQLRNVQARQMALFLGTDICQLAADLLAYQSQGEGIRLEIKELQLKLLATENMPKGGWFEKDGYSRLLKNPAGFRVSCLLRSTTLQMTDEQGRPPSYYIQFQDLCDVYPLGLCCKLCWEGIDSYQDYLDHKSSLMHHTRVDAMDRFLEKFRKACSYSTRQPGNDKSSLVSSSIAGASHVPFVDLYQKLDWVWAARSILTPPEQASGSSAP